MNKRADSIPGYLPVLDGVRALSLILIWVFHVWQQSWVFWIIRGADGQTILNLDLFQRCGYIAIDVFFVLSGFCLFYPLARSMFGDGKPTDWIAFYKKRARKILPSYLFLLLVIFLVKDLGYVNEYTAENGFKQFLSSLTFTSTADAMTHGGLVSTSWTLCIEVQFYLLFPAIAWLFKKRPVLSCLGIGVLSVLLRLWAVTHLPMSTVTQGIVFFYLDLFAYGMLAAYFVVWAQKRLSRADVLKLPMTLIAVVCLYLIYQYMKWMNGAQIPDMDAATVHRFIYRPLLNLPIALFLFASCFSYGFWQKGIWGNRVAAFLSTISYNFYLWHQNIHIYFKRHPVPILYTAEEAANHAHQPMIWFSLFTLAVSLLISIAVTYLLERPMYRYGFCGYFKKIGDWFKKK
ncbi:MAG: acyltransferase [Clostridia bacterium]|nr:acyltransferase [Clostridia bacterium]